MSGRARIVAVAVAALVAAAPAAAGVEVDGVDTSSFPTIHADVVSSAGASATPQVTENGHPVVGFDAQNLGRAKAVVLAVDDSQSMAGKPLADAAAAARTFVAAKSDADAIAVVEFGRHPIQLSNLSTAALDSDSALGQITVAGQPGTALYDAIGVSSSLLQASTLQGRVLIVLTDGRDVSSQRHARGGGRGRSRRARRDLSDRHRGTGLRPGAAAAARARDGRTVLRRRVDGRTRRGVPLHRRPARPHVAGLVRDLRPAGRPHPRRGGRARRRLGGVDRRRREARGRRHLGARRVGSRAVERIRIGRAAADRPGCRPARRGRVPAPARRTPRLVAAQPARAAHGRGQCDLTAPARQDDGPQHDHERDGEDVRPPAPVARDPADARPRRDAAPRGRVLLHRRRRGTRCSASSRRWPAAPRS